MKNRIVKILLLTVVAIMLFGAVTASAYESYETYTYSIDGEPLPSPHAYTPDVQPYDTRTMNLLGGNYWHKDSTGDVSSGLRLRPMQVLIIPPMALSSLLTPAVTVIL